jgi:hypothetical protein
MKVIIKRLWNEPAYLGAVLTAGVSLVVAFGFDADGQVVGAVAAAIAVITGVGVRASVKPTEDHTARIG